MQLQVANLVLILQIKTNNVFIYCVGICYLYTRLSKICEILSCKTLYKVATVCHLSLNPYQFWSSPVLYFLDFAFCIQTQI